MPTPKSMQEETQLSNSAAASSVGRAVRVFNVVTRSDENVELRDSIELAADP